MHRRDQRPPDLLDRAWGAFAGSLVAPFAESWRSTMATAAGIATFAALLASAPALYIETSPLAVFGPLDAAWRMAHGQWPHLDFPSPVGAFAYVLLDLAGSGPVAPLRATLIVLPFTTAAALVVTRARLPTALRLAVVLMIAFGTMSPRDLDSVGRIGAVALPDRLGWMLVSLVIAGALLAPRQRETRGAIVEVAMMSLALIATFYLDLELFLAALGALTVAAAAGGENRGVAVATAASSLALITAGFVVGSTNAAYLEDLAAASAAPRFPRLGPALVANQLPTLALAGALAAFLRTARGSEEVREARAVAARIGGMALLLWFVGAHTDHAALPALPVLLAAAYAAWRERWVRRADDPLPMQLVGALALAVVAAPVALDAVAIARHTGGAWSSGSAALVDLPADHTRGLRVAGGSETGVALRDGIDLLQRLNLDDRRIASLTDTQPFPWLLRAPPPRGWPNHAGRGHPFACPEGAFADVEVLLVPAPARAGDAWSACEAAVRDRYALADRSTAWTAWVRTAPTR